MPKICPGCGKKHGGQQPGNGDPQDPNQQPPPGPGGQGRGFGQRPIGDLDQPDGFKASRIRGKVGEGKIVGSYFRDGKQVKGESEAEYQEVMEAAAAKAAEALEKTRIPKGMSKYVRDYIDSITPERQ